MLSSASRIVLDAARSAGFPAVADRAGKAVAVLPAVTNSAKTIRMSAIFRRQFIQRSSLAGAGLLLARHTHAAASENSIEILLDEPIGTISPDLYGHFTEHIGGVIYDGIWVGEDSRIPNQGGIRTALIEHMKRLRPTV